MNELTTDQQDLLLRFLVRAFAYPDADFLKVMETFRQEEGNLPYLKEIVSTFLNSPLMELQAEYTRLFITGYPTTPCPPYESFFREGRMMGSVVYDIMRVYQEWGVQAELGLVDHLSTELEFLAYLLSATRIPELSGKAQEAYSRFREEHLKKWIPSFRKALEENAEMSVYRQLGKMLVYLE